VAEVIFSEDRVASTREAAIAAGEARKSKKAAARTAFEANRPARPPAVVSTDPSGESAVREARETLAKFLSVRADHEKKLAALGRERAELAFDAHRRGDPKSRKRLDELHLEAARADSEFLSIDEAIRVAQERVRDAEARHRAAVGKARTVQALSLTPGLRARRAPRSTCS
jgi:hypothetical protein